MATYISLMNLTEKGIKEIKDSPKRTEDAIKALEAMGGKLIGFYLVMGQYDYIGIAEAPSDEVALTFLFGLGADGNVRTTTFKAWPATTVAEIVGKLP